MPNISEILLSDGSFNIKIMIWSVFIGISIAVVVSYIIKFKFGAFVRYILEKNADSPETAVSLDDFGKTSRFIIKTCLQNHQNYKNMLVAVTSDGKYYTNCRYYSAAPAFKQYVFKTEKKNYDASEASEEQKTAPETPTDAPISQYDPAVKQRVTFNVETAKFYIPFEHHDRAASIYFAKPTKLIFIIGAIIGFAILVSLTDNLTDSLIDFMNSFMEKISGKNNII